MAVKNLRALNCDGASLERNIYECRRFDDVFQSSPVTPMKQPFTCDTCFTPNSFAATFGNLPLRKQIECIPFISDFRLSPNSDLFMAQGENNIRMENSDDTVYLVKQIDMKLPETARGEYFRQLRYLLIQGGDVTIEP